VRSLSAMVPHEVEAVL